MFARIQVLFLIIRSLLIDFWVEVYNQTENEGILKKIAQQKILKSEKPFIDWIRIYYFIKDSKLKDIVLEKTLFSIETFDELTQFYNFINSKRYLETSVFKKTLLTTETFEELIQLYSLVDVQDNKKSLVVKKILGSDVTYDQLFILCAYRGLLGDDEKVLCKKIGSCMSSPHQWQEVYLAAGQGNIADYAFQMNLKVDSFGYE